METILVVDDDESVRETIGLMLERENFNSILAADGKSGFTKAVALKPQLMLIDLRLPGMSGADVCKQLRAERIQTPIIIISGVREEIDKVLLLEMGADDYIEKPFGMRELLARVRAVLRRTVTDTRVLRFGDVEIDIDRRNTTKGGRSVKLTPAEYKLLLYFVNNPDRAFSRDDILNLVWGYESYPNSRTVDAHVALLRQKLEVDPRTPRHFVTVHRVGYRFLP